jgi:hypothetical protein
MPKKHTRKKPMLSIFATLFTISATPAFPDEMQPIFGRVTVVLEDGSFSLLEFGTTESVNFRFWGLKIIDVTATRNLLVDRTVSCTEVYDDNRLPAVYCLAYPNNNDIVPGSEPIPLLLWLSDFGYAELGCTDADRSIVVSDDNGKNWLCRAGIRPFYGPTQFE